MACLWLRGTDLGGEVDIGSSVEQQLCNAQVLVVSSDVEGREASLDREEERERALERDVFILFIAPRRAVRFLFLCRFNTTLF